MQSIGVFIKGSCLAYIYSSGETTWKFRSTNTINRTKKDGTAEPYVYRSEPFSSSQEALPFVCRFIKRQYNIDLALLKDEEVEFRKVPYTGRVSPTDVPAFMAKKFDAFVIANPSVTVATGNDEEGEDDEAPQTFAEAHQVSVEQAPAVDDGSIF